MYSWHLCGNTIVGIDGTQTLTISDLSSFAAVRDARRSLVREHGITLADEEWIRDLYCIYVEALPLVERNRTLRATGGEYAAD